MTTKTVAFASVLSLLLSGSSALAEAFNSRVRVYLPSSCQEALGSYDRLIQGESFIRFYGTKLPFFEFSNFWRAPIHLKGKVWPTSEHYFQAMKFEGTSHEEEVRNAPSPMDSAKIGRDRSRPLRPDWEAVKDRIMLEAVYAKFTQHPDLREVLLSTDDKILIEHTENDGYWGDKLDGSGSNKLGIVLMVVRDVLRNEANQPHLSIPEFMYIKLLAEERGFKVSLTGNQYVGDSRNYDINALRRALRDPLSAATRLKAAYHIGSRDNLLKSSPWEMRDDETTFNEIRFSVQHSDGSPVSLAERDSFQNQVYQGLALRVRPAPTTPMSEEFVLEFHENETADEPARQPALISSGLKLPLAGGPTTPELPGRLLRKFRVTSISETAKQQFEALDPAVGQEVEIRVSLDGREIELIKIGDYVIGKERIFSEGPTIFVYVGETDVFSFHILPAEIIQVFAPENPFQPLMTWQLESEG